MYFHLESGSLSWRRSWAYFIMVIPHLSLPEPQRIFLGSLLWEPGGVPGSKSHKSVVASKVSHLHTSPLVHIASRNSSKLPVKCFTSLWLQQLLLQVSISHLFLSGYTCLSRFQSCGLSCDLSFLLCTWKVVDFQFI